MRTPCTDASLTPCTPEEIATLQPLIDRGVAAMRRALSAELASMPAELRPAVVLSVTQSLAIQILAQCSPELRARALSSLPAAVETQVALNERGGRAVS